MTSTPENPADDATPADDDAVRETPVPTAGEEPVPDDGEPVDGDTDGDGDRDIAGDLAEEDDDLADEDDESEETASPLLPALGAVLGLTAIICVVLVAFGLPALKGGPHQVPIGLAGPTQVTSQLKQLFAGSGGDAFRVREYPSPGALRTAVQDRKVYGGIVIGDNAGRVSASMLVASGASPTIAQVLNSVAGELGQQISVEDVVPLPSEDPRGTGLAAVGLPIVLAGVLPGWLLVYRRFSGQTSVKLAMALGFALVSGFAIGAILQFWFNSVSGSYPLTSLALALGVAAIALPLTGLGAIAGRIGVGIGSALMVLVGYPLSGLTTAPEWFPGVWGNLGQALPPGATGTLLRSTAFFDGHGSRSALIVLAAWLVGGLLLIVVGTLLNPREQYLDDEADEPDDEDAPAPTPAHA